MVAFARLSLKVKLSLLITGLVVLTVVLVSALLIRQQQRALTAEITKRGLTIAENLAAGGKSALVTNDDLALNVALKHVMKDPDVVYAAFVDEAGIVRAHSDVAFIGKPLPRPAGLAPLGADPLVQTYESEANGDIIDFATPLQFSNVRIGALYIGFSQRSIAAALAAARNHAVVITFGLALLAVGGAVALATVLSRPIFRLVDATQKIAGGDFNVEVPVTTHDELGTLTESFNQMARSLREKEMIKRAFTRYVAREVVEEILKDPERMVLTGERREVTVLFCDIRGFTPIAERLSPEQVVSFLNEFYTLMIETTFRHGGTLDKFLGDAVMAVFGAPVRHPDHAIRAVRTALDMQAAMARLNERRHRIGDDPIRVGIGVSLGEAVAGTVGTEERMEYTVIGDSVNLAARLEANAKPGRILISQATYDRIRDQVKVRELGGLKVKGKEDEVDVYEVVDFFRVAPVGA